LGQLIQRSDSPAEDFVPVRGRNTTAPEAFHDISDLNQWVGEFYVVLHLHHPSMTMLA